MTTRNIKVVESDLSGKTDASTVTFGVGDTWFEIDLTAQEEKDLLKALEVYQSKARKASPKSTKKKVVPVTTPEKRDEIRAWASEQGFEFAERGRIPKKILAAYEAKFGKLETDEG